MGKQSLVVSSSVVAPKQAGKARIGHPVVVAVATPRVLDATLQKLPSHGAIQTRQLRQIAHGQILVQQMVVDPLPVRLLISVVVVQTQKEPQQGTRLVEVSALETSSSSILKMD